ncbi:SAM-dependent methyltransferase [Zhengella mangrovi]|uniref:SAM-dependent methyltransferase n=1 Tax=Zhengella mangrovi TaxID=1982044 RepID=A0A2G1QGC1_9HYPH|nr:class I SAM-dependent methyltransferase [Zhengella mangrovi]PHP64577.1 SAM-dependent methyltransferase [Zhengella mangrovi]
MTSNAKYDAWSAGQNYEHYMGRWSRVIATQFVDWLSPEPQLDWLELGCGTGALTSAILSRCSPKTITITDFSRDFVEHTSGLISDSRAVFEIADAQSLRFPDATFDAVASALTLNFIADMALGLSQMRRVAKPGGVIAFYVWDYPGGGMGFIDAFWKAAVSIVPAASSLDEARRFPFCSEDGIKDLCDTAGLGDFAISAIETETEFADFEAFWRPFTLGAGPAPGFCRSLTDRKLAELKDTLGTMVGNEGPIRMPARAWAVQCRV